MNQDVFVIIEHVRGKVADISYVMLAAAHDMVQVTKGEVVAVVLGHNTAGLLSSFSANRALQIEHPALAEFTSIAYQTVLESTLRDLSPRVVLLGDTSIGGDVGAWLSARLSWPLVSSCLKVSTEGDAIGIISQTCGGKIMTECKLPATCAIVMMVPGGYKPEQGQSTTPPTINSVPAPALDKLSVVVENYIEPDMSDIDISREPVLVAIGRGIQTQDNIALAEDLAQALGCPVCASRPLVDQGWLPSTRLVGKSGRIVKPKLYLSIGISGAPEHTEGISDSEMIVAINTDAAAPIFDIAKYGTTLDLFDLIPVLTEKIQEAKAH